MGPWVYCTYSYNTHFPFNVSSWGKFNILVKRSLCNQLEIILIFTELKQYRGGQKWDAKTRQNSANIAHMYLEKIVGGEKTTVGEFILAYREYKA